MTNYHEIGNVVGQTPAPAAGVGLCLSPALMNKQRRNERERQGIHRAAPCCGCHYGAGGKKGGP